MLNTVIVAIDLSEDSDALVSCLGGLKAYDTERCLLLLCLSPEETASIGLSYSTKRLDQSLQVQKESLEAQGFIVEARTLSGDWTDEINQIATDEGCSAIVVGARRRSKISELFFSGVVDNVLHHAQKPVLVIRLKEGPREEETCVATMGGDISSHVLFATDFSDGADIAFSYFTEMIARGAERITLLHVQAKARGGPNPENRLEEFGEIDRGRLQEMEKILRERGAGEVEAILRYGSPTAEITKVVDELDVKLVVMGNRRRGLVKEVLVGSVSHDVARLSSCSVLLVPLYERGPNG